MMPSLSIAHINGYNFELLFYVDVKCGMILFLASKNKNTTSTVS